MESHQEITDDLYDELEEVLIMGDVGIPTAQRVIRDLKAKIENDKITSVPQVRETMKDIVSVSCGAAAICPCAPSPL